MDPLGCAQHQYRIEFLHSVRVCDPVFLAEYEFIKQFLDIFEVQIFEHIVAELFSFVFGNFILVGEGQLMQAFDQLVLTRKFPLGHALGRLRRVAENDLASAYILFKIAELLDSSSDQRMVNVNSDAE